jgi:type IV secretion system protein VirB4
MHLDALLADEPLTGGLEPRLGAAHLRTLTVIGFPSATFPGLLDELNALGFAYRWSTRAIMLDKSDATKLLSKIRRQWFAKRKSVAAILKEVMTNEASVLVDSDAANKAEDADAALQELGADHVGLALVTGKRVLRELTNSRLDRCIYSRARVCRSVGYGMQPTFSHECRSRHSRITPRN